MEYLDHRDILKQGVEVWNKWREDNPKVQPQLAGTILPEANLREANLVSADLRGVNLQGVDLKNADLRGAYVGPLDIYNPLIILYERSNLSNANLRGANLENATFSEVNLSWANLSEANLKCARLDYCHIYAISAWNIILENTEQSNLIITREDESRIIVDDIEVAQFIYLILNNKKIRHVINTVTSKAVLILGRFSEERKVILDALREDLRKRNLLPILFDFEEPRDRNLTETVRTLAHLARFIIADLTEPSSIPQELQAIIPTLAVSVQPILLEEKREYAMFHDFSRYHWVLPIYYYKDQESLLASIETAIIQPAEKKAKELEKTDK